MTHRRFILIAAFAFLLRGIFILSVGSDPKMYLTPDSPAYLQAAKNVAAHNGFSESEAPPYEPGTVRTPGYPLFLMPFLGEGNPKILAIVWIQALLGGLTAGFLFLAGNALWRKSSAAAFAGLGLAFDYVITLYSSFVMTEALFLFLFCLSLFFFACFLTDPLKSRTNLLLAGFVSSLACLVRPVSLYYFLILLFVLAYAGWNQKIRNTGTLVALLFAASASLPALWIARNKAVAGAWTFTTIQGLTRAAILEERLSHRSFQDACAVLEERFKAEHPAGFPNAAKEASAKSLWATKYVLAHPVDYAVVLLQESVRLIAGNGMKASAWMLFKDPLYDPFTVIVHPTDSNRSQAQSLSSRYPPLGVALVVYLSLLGLVYGLALVGFIHGLRLSKPMAVWLALTAVYFFVVSIGFGTGARYRIPLMPTIYLLAGLGFEKLKDTHFLKKFFQRYLFS